MSRESPWRASNKVVVPNRAAFVGHRDVFGAFLPSERLSAILSRLGLNDLLLILAGINAAVIDLSAPDPALEQTLARLFMSPETAIELSGLGWPNHAGASVVFHRAAALALAKHAVAHCPPTGEPIGTRSGLGEAFLAMNDMLGQAGARFGSSDDRLAVACALLPSEDMSGGTQILRRAGRAHHLWIAGAGGERGRSRDVWGRHFRAAYGLSLADHIGAVFMAAANFVAYDPTSPSGGDRLWINPSSYVSATTVHPACFRRALDLLACEPDELATRVRGRLEDTPLLDTTDMRRRPLLRLGQDAYLCLDRGFLLDSLGEGLYWLVREAVPESERSGFERWYGAYSERK